MMHTEQLPVGRFFGIASEGAVSWASKDLRFCTDLYMHPTTATSAEFDRCRTFCGGDGASSHLGLDTFEIMDESPPTHQDQQGNNDMARSWLLSALTLERLYRHWNSIWRWR
jgi:hypothetical protein